MHSCPECGQACYCHGDIDDSEVETEEYSSEHCTHPGSAGCSGFDDADDYPTICPHGTELAHCEQCDADIGDIDVCLSCGGYYGTHAGLRAWDSSRGVAPQRCWKCWKEHGDPLPSSES